MMLGIHSGSYWRSNRFLSHVRPERVRVSARLSLCNPSAFLDRLAPLPGLGPKLAEPGMHIFVARATRIRACPPRGFPCAAHQPLLISWGQHLDQAQSMRGRVPRLPAGTADGRGGRQLRVGGLDVVLAVAS
jgi:hypothetical protein